MAKTNKSICLQALRKHTFTGHGTNIFKLSELTGLDVEKIKKAVTKLEDEGRGVIYVPSTGLVVRTK